MTTMDPPRAPAGWELPPNGAQHRSLSAAQATAKWLNSRKSLRRYEYRGFTLIDGSHRVLRRKRPDPSR